MGEVEHNSKHTAVDLDVSYGADFKDASKQIDLSFDSTHIFNSLTSIDGDISSRLRFPALVRIKIHNC